MLPRILRVLIHPYGLHSHFSSHFPIIGQHSSYRPISKAHRWRSKSRDGRSSLHHGIRRIPHEIPLVHIHTPRSHQNNRIFGQLSQFLNDGINRMSPAVHQNQIQIGELLHFFSYQRLHSHSAISIVRDKGNVFRFRIESLNHGDITFYIILIDKSRFQFGNIQMIFKDIDRFGHPAIKVFHRIFWQYHHITIGQTAHHRHFHLHFIPLRQIGSPRFLS